MCSTQSFYNGHRLIQGSMGRPLNRQKTNRCNPLIVTVCNNKEVIYQLLSAKHSSTVSEEQFETLDRAKRKHKNSDTVVRHGFFLICRVTCFPSLHVLPSLQATWHNLFPSLPFNSFLLIFSHLFCPFLLLSLRLICLSSCSLHRSPLGCS